MACKMMKQLMMILSMVTLSACQVTHVQITAMSKKSFTAEWNVVDGANYLIAQWPFPSRFPLIVENLTEPKYVSIFENDVDIILYKITTKTATNTYNTDFRIIPTDIRPITGVTITERKHDTISLQWDQLSFATQYEVEYYHNSTTTRLNQTDISNITLPNLANGTSYTIDIRTIRTNIISKPRNPLVVSVNFTLPEYKGITIKTGPPIETLVTTGIEITALSLTSLSLKWKMPENAKYLISFNFGNSSQSSTGVENGFFNDQEIPNDAASIIIELTLTHIGMIPVANSPAPDTLTIDVIGIRKFNSSLKITNVTKTKARITWDSIDAAKTYQVVYYENNVKKSFNISANTTTITNLQKGVKYTVTVTVIEFDNSKIITAGSAALNYFKLSINGTFSTSDQGTNASTMLVSFSFFILLISVVLQLLLL